MSQNISIISILKTKIIELINKGPDINCVDLSLLNGLQRNDFYMIKTAIAAGANIYIKITNDYDLLDIIACYLQDQDIVKLFMDTLLEDAIKKNDYNDILFAIKNGADIELLDVGSCAGNNTKLAGNCDEVIEF